MLPIVLAASAITGLVLSGCHGQTEKIHVPPQPYPEAPLDKIEPQQLGKHTCVGSGELVEGQKLDARFAKGYINHLGIKDRIFHTGSKLVEKPIGSERNEIDHWFVEFSYSREKANQVNFRKYVCPSKQYCYEFPSKTLTTPTGVDWTLLYSGDFDQNGHIDYALGMSNGAMWMFSGKQCDGSNE